MRNEIQMLIDSADKNQLNLGGQNISDMEIKEILMAVKDKLPLLQTLFLDNNQLSDKGAKIISDEIQGLSSLVFIDLQFNNLSAEGVGPIYLKAVHENLQLALAGTQIVDAEEMVAIEKESQRMPGYK